MTEGRRGRRGIGACAALAALGAGYLALGPVLLTRDPEAALRRAGWKEEAAAEDRDRVRRIVEAFFAGFNTMLRRGAGDEVRRRCEVTGRLLQPFCYEGAAAGYLPRGYFRWGYRLSRIEGDLERMDRGHTLLHYVGVGVWAALRHGADLAAAGAVAAGIRDQRHRSLVWNGYGFGRSALAPPHGSPGPAPCRDLPPTAATGCAHGFGRGLWFRHLGDEARALGQCGSPGDPLRLACATGVGLASTFVHPDRLEIPLAEAERLEPELREAYLRGVRAALLVRHQSDPGYVEGALDALPPGRRDEARRLLGQALACYGETIERDTFYDDFMACH